jgi:magnesium chelatase family protein
MLAHVLTAAVRGVDSYLVRVEVNLAPGLPAFAVVGLAQGAVREGRERVGAALRNAGYPLPTRRITVNLQPADVRKEGSGFDLPVAVGLLAAAGHLDPARLAGTAFLGELGLDGALRPIRGVLPAAVRCVKEGIRTLVVPAPNAGEAAVVAGSRVFGAQTLAEVVGHLNGGPVLSPVLVDAEALLRTPSGPVPDLRDVKGQEGAKRALEVAAAGSHNLMLLGPPGSGKTMLARRLPGILPPMTRPEALEATAVHSVAGVLPHGAALLVRRPFRAPHHTVSDAGLVGGGTSLFRPGEASLAHHGVLFLDELPEFRRNVLESLRQPLEDGKVRLARARGSERFPARFLLVGAMNPCPCGFWGDGTDRCLCDPERVARYRGRVSGPLLDRLDLHVEVPAVSLDHLTDDARGESSATVRRRVCRARAVQDRRFRDVPGVYANAQMDVPLLRRFVRPSHPVVRTLQRAVDRRGLSARGYHRVLKVARTLADLEGVPEVDVHHVLEALQYRTLDRRP